MFDLRDFREKIRSPLLAARTREESADSGLLNALQVGFKLRLRNKKSVSEEKRFVSKKQG